MLSINKIKHVKSLELKKHRINTKCFVVEGEKMVLELINSKLNTIELFATDDFLSNNLQILKKANTVTTVTTKDLKKISSLKTPNQALAIAEIPSPKIENNSFSSLNIALDSIQDPGNLGTIIRTANWFGVENIFCSKNTVDAYNPKVIQATMGAIFRTNIFYTNLPELINTAKNSGQKIYGTLLDGKNIYDTQLCNNGLIIMGNESKGISEPIQNLIDNKILIPNYPININDMESLNVGIANAIVLAEFRRQV